MLEPLRRKEKAMMHQMPLTAQLVADLFISIEHDDPPATFAAIRALSERIGTPAAVALARGLLSDRPRLIEPPTPQPVAGLTLVACA